MPSSSSPRLFVGCFFSVFLVNPRGFPELQPWLGQSEPADVEGRSGDESEAVVAKVSLTGSLHWSEKLTCFL